MAYSRNYNNNANYNSDGDPIKTSESIKASKSLNKKTSSPQKTFWGLFGLGFGAVVIMIGLFAVAAAGVEEYGGPTVSEDSILHKSVEVADKGAEKLPKVVDQGLDNASDFLDDL